LGNPSRHAGRGFRSGATSINSNFFEVEIPVVFRRKFFLDKELYLQNHPAKPLRETKEGRAARFQRLMDENGWTQAELASQLGVSRAWVTKVLNHHYQGMRSK
jgi:hypothetical protein